MQKQVSSIAVFASPSDMVKSVVLTLMVRTPHSIFWYCQNINDAEEIMEFSDHTRKIHRCSAFSSVCNPRYTDRLAKVVTSDIRGTKLVHTIMFQDSLTSDFFDGMRNLGSQAVFQRVPFLLVTPDAVSIQLGGELRKFQHWQYSKFGNPETIASDILTKVFNVTKVP